MSVTARPTGGLNAPATLLSQDNMLGLTARPELVEGWAVKPFMVRQAHHERLNLKLSRLKLVANAPMGRVGFRAIWVARLTHVLFFMAVAPIISWSGFLS